MTESLNISRRGAEEDVMDLMSVGDECDITREEENTLLMSDDMAIDSPLKKRDNDSSFGRKQIVFDLGDNGSALDDDNEDSLDGMRDKFRSERTGIPSTLTLKKTKAIPDSLDFSLNDIKCLMTSRDSKRLRKQRKRLRNRPQFGPHGGIIGHHVSHRNNRQDLRQLISRNSQRRQGFGCNSMQNQSMSSSLTPLMNWQMDLGILNPNSAQNQILAQNQLLVNALLAQNPLLNRLQTIPPIGVSLQNIPPLVQNIPTLNQNISKPKDDIQITIINANNRPVNRAKTQTRPQIRCLVNNDPNSSQESIEDLPTFTEPNKNKPQLKTLFSKHLANKVSQSNASAQQSVTTSSGGLFADALAEVEVGVDNEYLARMQEMENKRKEIQKKKEQRRLEMADQRLQSAQELKQQISSNRNF